jgi:DNA polymerase-3 subunit gamma/tau
MRGATSPRLLLEIMAARLLLPGADDADRGLQVRVEQLERQSRQAAAGRPAPAPAVVPTPVTSQPVAPTTAPVVADDVVPAEVAPAKSKKGTQAAATGTDVEAVRRKWPEIVEEIKNVKRSAWIQLNRPGSGVLSVDQSRVAVGLPDVGTAKGFVAGGYDQLLATAISQVMGSPYTVDVIGQPVPDSLTVAGLSAAPAAAPAEQAPAASPKRKSGRDIIEAEKAAKAEPAAAVVDDTNIETDETELVGEALITAAFDAKSLGELESDS